MAMQIKLFVVVYTRGNMVDTYPQEAMCVNGSFDSLFVHLIKSTVNNFGVQSSAICNSSF